MEVEVWLVCLLAQRNFLSHISLAVYMFQATWMCAVLRQMLCFLLLPPTPPRPTYPPSQFCWVCFVFCFIFPLALGFFFSFFLFCFLALWCHYDVNHKAVLYIADCSLCCIDFGENRTMWWCIFFCVWCVCFCFFTVAWRGPVGTVVSSLCWSLDTEALCSESLHWRRDISGRGARVDLRCQFVQLHWETDCWRWWRVLLFKNPFYLLFFSSSSSSGGCLVCLCCAGLAGNVPGRLFHRHRCFFLSILLTDFCTDKQYFFLLCRRIEVRAFWMFSVGENLGGGGGGRSTCAVGMLGN